MFIFKVLLYIYLFIYLSTKYLAFANFSYVAISLLYYSLFLIIQSDAADLTASENGTVSINLVMQRDSITSAEHDNEAITEVAMERDSTAAADHANEAITEVAMERDSTTAADHDNEAITEVAMERDSTTAADHANEAITLSLIHI